MSEIVKINILELASTLATTKTMEEMFSSGLILNENEMYTPENEGVQYFTEQAQDIFNNHYDYYTTLIENHAE